MYFACHFSRRHSTAFLQFVLMDASDGEETTCQPVRAILRATWVLITVTANGGSYDEESILCQTVSDKEQPIVINVL